MEARLELWLRSCGGRGRVTVFSSVQPLDHRVGPQKVTESSFHLTSWELSSLDLESMFVFLNQSHLMNQLTPTPSVLRRVVFNLWFTVF